MPYQRVLLKLSGEAMAGSGETAIDPDVCSGIAEEIHQLHAQGVQFGLVIGGGNIFRGAALATSGMDRCEADTVGMLATLINSLVMRGFLERAGVPTVVMSATPVESAAETFSAGKARRYLNDGTVVILAGGTGNPFFTTDTAAALRCAELQADVLLKATKVDGIYDTDPVVSPNAVKLNQLTYEEALSRGLRVMDSTAFSFCMEQAIPIVVFKLVQGNLRRCVKGEPVGSTVTRGV